MYNPSHLTVTAPRGTSVLPGPVDFVDLINILQGMTHIKQTERLSSQ